MLFPQTTISGFHLLSELNSHCKTNKATQQAGALMKQTQFSREENLWFQTNTFDQINTAFLPMKNSFLSGSDQKNTHGEKKDGQRKRGMKVLLQYNSPQPIL